MKLRDLLSRIKKSTLLFPFGIGMSIALGIYIFFLGSIVSYKMKHPGKREITQIATVTESQTTSFSGVVALCDDGTVWLYSLGAYPILNKQWQRLPDIPRATDE